MSYFINHKLIKTKNGYIVELYLDEKLNEFSKELFNIGKKHRTLPGRKKLKQVTTEYINQQFPDIKIKTAKIMVGSLLVASIALGTSAVNVKAQSTPNAQSQTTQMYTIKSGDTLYLIAKRFGTTVSLLKQTNGLTGDLIYSGQQLRIPSAQYKVISGDTLYKISIKFNITIPQLKSNNGLTSDMINIGQILKIPYIVTNPSSALVLVNKTNNLASNYIPKNMTVPKVKFSFNEYDDKKLMRADAATALEGLFAEAKSSGIDIYAVSGYRSFARQSEIFTSSANKYGQAQANKSSARAGQSEHQTGLAMDLTSASVNYVLSQEFGNTKEGVWLKANASKHGFIIRYQQGKESITGYQYEPWHIRYVGKKAAQDISSWNITLEEYLGSV